MMNESVRFFVSKFRELLATQPAIGTSFRPRPYRNAAVSFRNCAMEALDERWELLQAAGLNVFFFPAAQIPGCDLLSDSGTTTMTMEQWSQLLLGDEAYGSNEGYFQMKDQVAATFGPAWRQQLSGQDNLYLFHQGRAAEHALSTVLRDLLLDGADVVKARATVKKLSGDLAHNAARKTAHYPGPFLIIPSNSHFDTTEGNLDACSITPLNLPCKEHVRADSSFPFRGNMDTDALAELLEHCRDIVPVVYLTITNNTGGGQPVSMQNIRKVREITDRYEVPFFFDACRFAENAWFIKQREPGYSDKAVAEIVHEMFSYVDGFHISLKKDGLANMGGALVLKQEAGGPGRFARRYPTIPEALTGHQIMVEGHPTYGGLAGRDIKAIAQGLRTVTDERYLRHRVEQVQRFGERLAGYGIPVIQPFGASAIYLDMDRFFCDGGKRDHEFRGIAFTALLLLAGHRLCELGIYAFGRQVGGKEMPPEPRVNNVRAAVPRLAYEDQDLLACAEAVRVLYENRERIPGVRVEHGQDLPMRHFKSRFSFLD
jgi:tryptophanase